MNDDYRRIITDGLWNNNQALVALLGLCPLLAISNTLINGLGLGLATTLVLTLSNLSVSLIRNWVRPEIRLPVFVLIIASFVTTVELIMNAYFHGLYKVLGIFIPLIVTNCAIIGRAEAFASRNPVPRALADGLSMGIGFTLALVVLGGSRELIGQGTVKAIAVHAVGQLPVAEAITGACPLQVVGKPGHALGSAHDDEVALSPLDGVHAIDDREKTRATRHVQGIGGP